MSRTKGSKNKEVVGEAVEVKLPKFRLVMKVNDTEYVKDGDTVFEALKQITLPFVKTNSVISVISDDGKISEMIFNVVRTKRLFINRVFMEYMAKNLTARLHAKDLK